MRLLCWFRVFTELSIVNEPILENIKEIGVNKEHNFMSTCATIDIVDSTWVTLVDKIDWISSVTETLIVTDLST